MPSTFNAARDGERLETQAQAVWRVFSDGETWTLAWLASATGYPEASISARLRDFRKAGHTIERKFVKNGLHTYRYVAPEPPPEQGTLPFEVTPTDAYSEMLEAERRGTTHRMAL